MAENESPDIVISFTLPDGRRAHAEWGESARAFVRSSGPPEEIVWVPTKLVVSTWAAGARLVVTGHLRDRDPRIGHDADWVAAGAPRSVILPGSIFEEPPPFDVQSIVLDAEDEGVSDEAIDCVTAEEIDLIVSEALAEVVLFIADQPHFAGVAGGSAKYAGETRQLAQARRRGPKGPTNAMLTKARETYDPEGGVTFAEVGEMFGISESTAHRWVQRAEREGL